MTQQKKTKPDDCAAHRTTPLATAMAANQPAAASQDKNEDKKRLDVKECNPSIKKILNNALPHLLNKLLGEIEDLSTNSIQPLLGDESNAAANEEATAAHYRFLKALSEKHKTLKIILQNLSLILELNPRGNEKEKNEISNLLARAENLIGKKIITDSFEENSSTQDSPNMDHADKATNHATDNRD